MAQPKKKSTHKHRWGRQYRNIFNGPVRLCMNGRCGAMRFASGRIVKCYQKTEASK